MSAVELAPIVKTLDVRRTPADAFRLFTEEIGAWWPTRTHSRAKDDAGERTETVELEPYVGGRIFERLNTGEMRDWGEVLAYEAGTRVRFSFQMGRAKAESGEVEVRFEPVGEAACRVTLTHEHWERFGEEAQEMRGRFDEGWEFVFVNSFGAYAGLK